MSAGWKVGDLALCVDDGPCACGCGGEYAAHHITVKSGQPYRVALVLPWGGDVYLGMWGDAVDEYGVSGNARRFRKILPDERQACEPEFVTLLKRSKKRVSA